MVFPSSVTFIAKGGHDAYIHALANDFHLHQAELLGATEHKVSDLKQTVNEDVAVTELSAKEMAIAVVGAHMQGFPLNHQLTNKGGRFLKRTNTAPNYRLFKLGEEIPLRPGLLKVDDGHQIELEVWAIPKSKFGDRVKQLLGGRLSLRNYNAQVGETYAMIKALNKLTGLGMPETQCIV